MDGLQACVSRRWVRAPEDDRPGVLRYRAEDSGLVPRTRLPRDVLEFTAGGRFTYFVPGPTDARVGRSGRWDASAAPRITLHWDDGAPDTAVDVVDCSAAVLAISLVSGAFEAPEGAGASGSDPSADTGRDTVGRGADAGRAPTAVTSACLPGGWVRAPEDDGDGVARYRRADATGVGVRRPDLEFRADGRLLSLGRRGAEPPIPRPGRWQLSAPGSRATLRWDDGGPDTIVDVVECTGAVLELSVRSGSLD